MHILAQYLDNYKLWDERALAAHCAQHSVYIRKSELYPGLALLHYADGASYGKLWDDFNMMCRGAILDMTNRRVLAWPFNKFFNLGEHESTDPARVAAMGDFVATEKLDGSLLILFNDPNTGKNWFATKGSLVSEHAVYANAMIPETLRDLKLEDHTYMFELISGKFPNVINYRKRGYTDGVYLIGARNNLTGSLFRSAELHAVADTLRVPRFKRMSFTDLDSAVRWTMGLPGEEEGYVLRFDNEQFLVKVKGLAYIRAHRVIQGMNDSAVLESLFAGKRDVLLSQCPEEYRKDVAARFGVLEKLIAQVEREIRADYAGLGNTSRKEFAAQVRAGVRADRAKFMFLLRDGRSIREALYKHVQATCIECGKITKQR